jgi:hypothetical protein
MSRIINFFFFLMLITIAGSSLKTNSKKNYKCLVQMKNYTGEGAYLIISLVNNEGKYLETLYVQGEDEEWYHEITSWWNFYGKNKVNIDGISGETLSGGGRSVYMLSIDKSKIANGFKIRFETAVEDKNYYERDLEITIDELNTETKYNGTGFIRYVRMIDN